VVHDVIGPASARNQPGFHIDLYRYSNQQNALASTRQVKTVVILPPKRRRPEMPYWKLSLLTLCAIASCSNDDALRMSVQDGIPFVKKVHGVTLSFDGQDGIFVKRGEKELKISARSPSTLTMSPEENYIALNYGSGSGQVLGIEVYDARVLTRVRGLDLNYLAEQAVRRNGCDVKPDEISYVFERWLSNNEIEVLTENWSRRSECPSINRKWIVKLQ